MKLKILSLITVFIAFTSCSLDNNNDYNYDDDTLYTEEWHLVEVNGGIAGNTIEYDLNDIVWVFNSTNSSLTVNNTNTEETQEDGLDTGTYYFETTPNESETYNFIFINDEEFGAFGYATSSNLVYLIIDQKIKYNGGTENDSYVYAFQRVLVPVEETE
ncbi:MAG: hypothetical protein ACK5NB_10740 [Flavobacteriaceae bacterium]